MVEKLVEQGRLFVSRTKAMGVLEKEDIKKLKEDLSNCSNLRGLTLRSSSFHPSSPAPLHYLARH